MKPDLKTRKGQSAIEYLTTYGWMLLVVAIVGGAIFTTVQGQTQIQSVSGLTDADVQVNDFGLNDNGLQLSLRAVARDQVNIQKIKITDPETGVSAEITPSKVIPVGDTAQVNLQDVQTTETTGTYQIKIFYNTGGLEGVVAQGKITGNLGVFNRISLQNAKFNRSTNTLKIDVKNIGDNTTSSISYKVKANNTEYTGTLPNLNPGETSQINITTDRTYPLQSVSLNTEGTQFVDSSSGLKCTPTKGLVGYWTFNNEQKENNQLKDISGYRNHGSLINGANVVEDGIGESVKFDGSDDHVRISDSNSLNISNGITVSARVKAAESSYPYPRIVSKGYPDGYELVHKNSTHVGIFDVTNTSGRNRYVEGSNNLVEEGWTHLAGTIGQRMNIYEGKSLSQSEKWEGDIEKTNKDLWIGATGEGYYEYYRGLIDEVRIYNRSLSQSEIQRLYQVRSEGWAVSGCKLTK